MKIVVVGSINLDYTLQVDKLPEKGETILAKNYKISLGGKGANQAIAAKRLGADVFMIGAVGSDDKGNYALNKLEEEGLNLSGILNTDDITGNAIITIDNQGFNTIVVYPGSNEKLSTLWVEKHSEIFKEADFVILQLEIPLKTVESAIRLAKENNTKVILNPAPVKNISEDIYKYVDYITPNETELFKMTGTTDIKEGAKKLLDKGVKEVIVTLGEKGCYYTNGREEIIIDSIKVNAIDTTAAGDSFNAALAVALCQFKDIKKALKYANVVGALTTTKIGAYDALPYKIDVDDYITNNNYI